MKILVKVANSCLTLSKKSPPFSNPGYAPFTAVVYGGRKVWGLGRGPFGAWGVLGMGRLGRRAFAKSSNWGFIQMRRYLNTALSKCGVVVVLILALTPVLILALTPVLTLVLTLTNFSCNNRTRNLVETQSASCLRTETAQVVGICEACLETVYG